MRLFTLIAMLTACLAYGLMPARAASLTQQAAAIHAPHVDMAAGQHAAPKGDPCPHRGGPAHSAFCAACLAIVPVPEAGRKGHPPFSFPQPGRQRPLAALFPAPAEPPPRT